MFVGMDAAQPRHGGMDADTEFFFEFALQRGGFALASLDLAAGKFPIAGIRLACRTGRQQVFALAVQDDAGDDVKQRAGIGCAHIALFLVKWFSSNGFQTASKDEGAV